MLSSPIAKEHYVLQTARDTQRSVTSFGYVPQTYQASWRLLLCDNTGLQLKRWWQHDGEISDKSTDIQYNIATTDKIQPGQV